MKSIEERFWSKVEKRGDGCWIWTAKSDRFRVDRTMWMPNRLAYALSFGPPGDDCVLQRCGNSLCVNPDHLFLSKPLGVRKVVVAQPATLATGTELEKENDELRRLLLEARAWFIAGWRHQRPRRYLRFRQEMNKALKIPLDFDY